MRLASFKSDMYKVDEDFHNNFNAWCGMSEKEKEKVISKYPIHIKGGVRTITDKEFANLENKNWHR